MTWFLRYCMVVVMYVGVAFFCAGAHIYYLKKSIDFKKED